MINFEGHDRNTLEYNNKKEEIDQMMFYHFNIE